MSQVGRPHPALRTLAAVALPLALAATTVGVGGPALAEPAPVPSATDGSLNLMGTPASPQKATLITGDVVTVQSGVGNRNAINVQPASRLNGIRAAVAISGKSNASGVEEQITARPEDALPYLQSGSVDPGLFDVRYLLDHETAGHLRVVVQYATPMADADLAGKADGLPASTLVQTQDAANAAAVDVDLAHATEFWGAITGQTKPSAVGSDTDQLADGVSAVWLDGHRLGNPGTVTPAAEPTYTVTEIIHASVDPECSQPQFHSKVCLQSASLLGLDGISKGFSFAPTSYVCVTDDPICDTVKVTFKVPAARYSLSSFSRQRFDDHNQFFVTDDPEFQVVNDTTLEFKLADATKVVNDTPKPVDTFNGLLERTRILQDGGAAFDLLWAQYGDNNYWAVPTQPVTVGAYFMKTVWELGQPMLTMSATGTKQITLHAAYPSYKPGWQSRFHGTQSGSLVDGGTGTVEDLAKVDARGKLVLMRPPPFSCLVTSDQMQNALHAGALGVLIDPTTPDAVNGHCEFPIQGQWPQYFDHPDIPFVDLKLQEAQTLRGLLNKGSVKITAADNGDTAYSYFLTDVEKGQIPASLTHTVTDKQLAETDTSYHSTVPATAMANDTNWLTDEVTAGSLDYVVAAPTSRKSYFTASPELIYWRTMSLWDFWHIPYTGFMQAQKYTVYAKAGPIGQEVWNDEPLAPGPADTAGVERARPGYKPIGCSVCRQGNLLLPWTFDNSRDPTMEAFDPDTFFAGVLPDSVHLFKDGQELGQTKNNPAGWSEYTLPPEPANYRLTMDGHNTQTTWNFTSAAPTVDHTPVGYFCSGTRFGISDPCEPVPLIFLRYDAGTDAQQSVSAGTTHQLHISAYGQDPDAPAVTAMKVWTSVDGGKTWTPADTGNQGHGKFAASYHVSNTDHTVSIKVQAQDSAGNDVTQVITDAFAVAARS